MKTHRVSLGKLRESKEMSRRSFLRETAVGLGVGLIGSPLLARRRGRRDSKLNVLFIMTDQHNVRALGCYGNKEVRTPNMDRLAAEGVLFEHAICQTGQCVPSRYSIFTGRYARSTGTYSNGQLQNVAEKTVAELFKEAGYTTAAIGKHHMVMDQTTQNHGFDTVFVPNRAGLTKAGEFLPYDEVHPGRANVGETALSNDEHPAGQTANEAIRFLRKNREKPFVLWYSFYGPNTPICVSAPWSKQYDPDKLTLPENLDAIDRNVPGMAGLLSKSGKYSKVDFHRRTLAYYYGLVSQIDYNIGRVLDELEELGLSENTIVVYTADHGEMMGEHGAWTKGRTGYEATVAVPMILRLPGVLAAGKRIGELACSIDLLPTLLEAAGLRIPDNIQGKSLLPPALGRAKSWRQYAFSELGASAQNTCIAVRSSRYKYVLWRTRGQTEYEQLFDLDEDEWEIANLLGDSKYSAVLSEMREALAKWEGRTKAARPMQASESKTRRSPKVRNRRNRRTL